MTYTNQQLLQALKTDPTLSKLANNAWDLSKVICNEAELYQSINSPEQILQDVFISESADSEISSENKAKNFKISNPFYQKISLEGKPNESLNYFSNRLRVMIEAANQLINSNFLNKQAEDNSFFSDSVLTSEKDFNKCRQLLLKEIRGGMITSGEIQAELLTKLDPNAKAERAIKNLHDMSKIYVLNPSKNLSLGLAQSSASQSNLEISNLNQITLAQAVEQLITLNQASKPKQGYIALFDSYVTEAPTLPLLRKLIETEQNCCYPVPISHPLLVYILRKEYLSTLAEPVTRFGNFMLWLDAKAYWLTYAQAWGAEDDIASLSERSQLKKFKRRFHNWIEQQLVKQFLTYLGVSESQVLTWFAETAEVSVTKKLKITPTQSLTIRDPQLESKLSFAQLQQTIVGLVASEQIGVYLTPGNLVTPSGYRLGYGGGYYDFEIGRREKSAEQVADPANKEFYSVFWGYDYCLQPLVDKAFQEHDRAVDKIFLLPFR